MRRETMTRPTSPLRYPGGKICLLDSISHILRTNRLQRGHYAEPYAGGAGLALALLYGGYVSDIHINDLDQSIWAFWTSVLNQNDNLVELVLTTPVTIEEWHRQRDIQRKSTSRDTLELGFATFFLNRTNRSGIIKQAGVIGGLNQSGRYKIDCRFNREDLARRIRRVIKYRSRIHLYHLDAINFMRFGRRDFPERTFFYIDPPYFNQGSSLYTSFYGPEDHADVSTTILALPQPWVVTYDNVDQIAQLYRTRRQYAFDINYSANRKRIGTELMVASKGLKLPANIRAQQVHAPQYRVA